MIMCVLLCYPVSIRIYYQQGGRFLVATIAADNHMVVVCKTTFIKSADIMASLCCVDVHVRVSNFPSETTGLRDMLFFLKDSLCT